MEVLCLQCRTRFFLFSSKQIRTVAIVNHSPRVVQLYATLHHPPTDPRPPAKKLQKRTKLNGLVLDDKVILSSEEKREGKEVTQCKLLDNQWREQKIDVKKLPYIYLRLSKYRLTSLVVLTTLVGYAMAPCPTVPSVLLYSCMGTALCSAAANTFNQWLEVPFDSQMSRTKNRVLVRGMISPLHALSFGLVSGVTGTLILATGVNTLTAALGVFNIFLYSAVYTPMKRLSITNTWIGSVVGAIPPVMGWTACTGSLSPAVCVLAGILFAWQFPHFNALSWSHQADYSRGGYRMMSVTDPLLCRTVALRYSLALIPICTAAPVLGLTTWWFVFDSAFPNLWLSYLSWRFYRDSDFKSARNLFRFSLFHLPFLLVLMLLNKTSWNSNETTSLSSKSE